MDDSNKSYDFNDLLDHTPTHHQEDAPLPKDAYAAKKQAEREAIYALSDNTAMAVSYESGKLQQYLDVQSVFSRYGTVNVLLIMAQKPDATRLGSFAYWNEQGGFVKSGQTGISILEPHTYTKEDGSTGTGYNLKKVFDISQVDTRKISAPTAAPPPAYTHRQLLQALISKAPVKIVGVDAMPDYAPEGQGAIFDLSGNQIMVQKGMDFKDTFQSVAQELSLAEMGQDPNHVSVNPSFSAYCAAYMLCKKHGVETNSFSFSGASDVLYGLDAQAIKGELSHIRRAADNIDRRMAKHLDSVVKAAKNQEAR